VCHPERRITSFGVTRCADRWHTPPPRGRRPPRRTGRRLAPLAPRPPWAEPRPPAPSRPPLVAGRAGHGHRRRTRQCRPTPRRSWKGKSPSGLDNASSRQRSSPCSRRPVRWTAGGDHAVPRAERAHHTADTSW